MQHNQSQQGMVSILTVLFLMIFISILMVGFMKIMADEQRQATDNDLSASALAAARSGIEDGKRIIMQCNGTPVPGYCTPGGLTAPLQTGDGAGDCSAIPSNNALVNVLKMDRIGSTNSIQVGEADYQQSYTCLTISTKTDTITFPEVAEQKSTIVPLTVEGGSFDQLDITWKARVASTYAVPAATYDLPKRADWRVSLTGAAYPPILRIQLIPYTAGAVNLDASEAGSRTLFVRPTTAGPLTAASSITTDGRAAVTGMPRSGSVPVVYGACTTAYECTKTLTGFNAANKYYARISLVYGDSASVSLVARKAGAVVKFDGVQPEIDVTGRTNDVYRRVRARVSFSMPNIQFPEYALETASPVCKRIVVADLTNTLYNCP